MMPSVESMLILWSNASTSLNKTAAMPIYVKTCRLQMKALGLNLGKQHWGLSLLVCSKDDTRMTFLQCGQIYVLIAIAIMEEVPKYLQICNSCFYQVSKLWCIGLLFYDIKTATSQ